MNRLFHKHTWIKIKETYAEPAPPLIEIRGSGELEWNQLIFIKGLTTILWECSICKRTKKVELLGKG